MKVIQIPFPNPQKSLRLHVVVVWNVGLLGDYFFTPQCCVVQFRIGMSER